MGALWQYRWLVLVLLIAPTIAYCQYRAVERLATERCANAGGTWDEEQDECTGLAAPKAAGSDESDAAAADLDAAAGTAPEPADEPAAATTSGATDSPHAVQYVPAEGAGEAQVEAPRASADDGSGERTE
jgi:hypothetical protein